MIAFILLSGAIKAQGIGSPNTTVTVLGKLKINKHDTITNTNYLVALKGDSVVLIDVDDAVTSADTTSLAGLTAGLFLISFDGNPYNPLTGPKTFAVDSAALVQYLNNYYTNVTNPPDSADYDFIVFAIDETPNYSYDEGTKVLVAATGTTGDFVDHENDVATLTGGVYSYESPSSGDQLLLSNEEEAILQPHRYDGTQWIPGVIPLFVNGNHLGVAIPYGTTDSKALIIKTNNVARVRYAPNGDQFWNKFKTIPSNNFLKIIDTATGKVGYDSFNLPVYDSPAISDSIAYIEDGQIKYGLHSGGGGTFIQADTIIYLSKSAGVVSDANLLAGSTSGFTDNTTAVQDILDIAQTKSIKVIWDVRVAGGGWVLYSNTEIEAIQGKGAILLNGAHKAIFKNADTAFARDIIDSNIVIKGGVWNGNYANQSVIGTPENGSNVAFAFYGVRNLIVRDFQIYNQKTYAIHCINVKNGLVENGLISSAMDALYTDGLHFDGNSRDCIGRNLRIRGGDDAITNNADDMYLRSSGGWEYIEGYYPAAAAGPISNIRYENIYLDSTRYGYRALSGASRIDNIVVRNLSGNARGYWSVIDNYLALPDSVTNAGSGNIGTITIENVQVNVYASTGVSNNSGITISADADKIILKDIKRYYSYDNSKPTVLILNGHTIKSLVIDGYDSYDTTLWAYPHIYNNGAIVNSLSISRANLYQTTNKNAGLFENNGTTHRIMFNGIYADSLRFIYKNVTSNKTSVVAANIYLRSASAAFTTSTTDSLYLSNIRCETVTASSWGLVKGDAFLNNYFTLSGNSLYPNSTSYNLGLGNTSPSNKLTVTGNQDITGNLSVGATSATLGKIHVEGTGSGTAVGIRNTTNTGEAYIALFNDETLSSTTGAAAIEYYGSSFGTVGLRGSLSVSSRKNINLVPGYGVATGSTNHIALYGGGNATTQERMRVSSDGVWVGTTTGTGSALTTTSFATAYRSITGARTLDATDHTINCTSGTFSVTLPTAASIAGREYTIVNSGAGTITIATTSSQTFTNINATPTSLTLAPVGAGAIVSYTVKSTGSNWIVIAKVKDE